MKICHYSVLGHKKGITTSGDDAYWAESPWPCLQGHLDPVKDRHRMFLCIHWRPGTVVGHPEAGGTHRETLPGQEAGPDQSTGSLLSGVWTNNGMSSTIHHCIPLVIPAKNGSPDTCVCCTRKFNRLDGQTQWLGWLWNHVMTACFLLYQAHDCRIQTQLFTGWHNVAGIMLSVVLPCLHENKICIIDDCFSE